MHDFSIAIKQFYRIARNKINAFILDERRSGQRPKRHGCGNKDEANSQKELNR